MLLIAMHCITDHQHTPTVLGQLRTLDSAHYTKMVTGFCAAALVCVCVCYMLSRRSTRPVLAAARVCRVRVGVRGGPEVCELLKRVWMPTVEAVCVSGGLMGFRGSD